MNVDFSEGSRGGAEKTTFPATCPLATLSFLRVSVRSWKVLADSPGAEKSDPPPKGNPLGPEK